MTTHTHRGHCQLCGRIQAIDTTTGRLAQHGYNVQAGYFQGACAGSGELSLHVERTLTDSAIASARAAAADAAAQIAGLDAGTLRPAQVNTGDKYNPETRKREPVMVAWADAKDYERADAVRSAKYKAEQDVRFWTNHADTLTKWADRITGKVDAYRVTDLEPGELAVGDVIRIGGKKGFDATIEAIGDQKLTTRGFRRGTQTITVPHIRVTRPAITEKRARDGYVTREARPALTYWEPIRNLKREPSQLVKDLKADGLL